MLKLLVPTAHAIDIATEFGPAKYFNTLGSLVNVLLPNLFTIAGTITLGAIVIAGIKVIAHAGSGDAKETEKDKAAFTAAVVGLIIIVTYFFCNKFLLAINICIIAKLD